MNHSIMGAATMDQDNHLVQDEDSHMAHNHTFGNDGWSDMSPYGHQNGLSDYGGFAFMPTVSHGLPSESIGRMAPPPAPVQPMQSHQQSHAQLPMLMIPSQPTWPSMLTNPNSYSAPPLGMAPIVAPAPSRPTTRLPNGPQPQQRRVLSDDDRKKMCQYAAEHPNVKQTDIGAMFGVERSTVSKVLRNKEKYLNPEADRSQSPAGRRHNKGKFPDIDRAVAAWVRKQQQAGLTPSDDEILDQAKHFSRTTNGAEASLLKSINTTWLERFKQRNILVSGKLLRRASETNITDHAKLSGSPSLGASAVSPASPTGHPSPLSADRSDEDAVHGLGFVGYGEGGAYKHTNSQSTTSLNSALTDTGNSSFSGSALSPTATFTFSPDPNTGQFLANDPSRQLHGGAGSNFQRPRSQTFPTLDIEYMNQVGATESMTPKYHPASTAPSSALESPVHEMAAPHFCLDTAISSSPHLHHSSSNSSMAGRSTTTPAGSSPTSPTQEDARKAADTLLSYIQSNSGGALLDQTEYMMMIRLTEKLRLQQHQLVKTGAPQSLGILDRIPEGDTEMLPQHPPPMHLETKSEPVVTQ
ncbi:Putative HTH CenpB-type DNA-binding domain, Homeobox-like domain superfamily [Colletotrichum destructivum]|uniref:HTH CenpB-type DNA-binding domain, Homeobox-like domain superfamily n=1 Tax=Colletotrichum destructivum TaxID=34406 RepID=A0AAX4HXR1_9PEZI|nr:Putative HTH CenpB-type DNA-binding domain, Homeobox-like domain superfamily [Colletotrichum destructivum]